MDTVNINNIMASVLVHGDMWFNPLDYSSLCYHPADTWSTLHLDGAIWLSGYDGGDNLHIAAQMMRSEAADFWPGPAGPGPESITTSQNWAWIWKVNRSDIAYFLSLSSHTTSNTPQAILTWPAKGNAYAQGNGGISLAIPDNMAPFVDLNGNGIYEPLLGEYPDVPGDQALWWVFNDNGPVHNATNGTRLGVEVHAMAYAYHRGTLIDDVIYYDYTIINKSATNYHNFRLAQWDAAQLGWGYDDFIGFDSTWRMGVVYNGTNDDGGGAGHPVGYGINPPQTAITLVTLPGDGGGNFVPAGSFTYFNNDASIIGNPATDAEFDNYMRSKIRNGQHITNDYQGPGVPCASYGTGPSANYAFPGDPGIADQPSECGCNGTPGQRRTVLATNDFALNAGQAQHVVLALLVADSAKGCPVTSFYDISVVADTAWTNYYYSLFVSKVPSTFTGKDIAVYPNPAQHTLYIDNGGTTIAPTSIAVYNIMGQQLNVPVMTTGQKYELNISSLPQGVYIVKYASGDTEIVTKFLKQ